MDSIKALYLSRETGIYQNLGESRYFVPHPLPPSNPSLELTAEIAALYGEASFNLGRLNEMALRLPDPKRFIKAYVMKEALLSSAIEGIHTTMIDVFTASMTASKPNKETQLVINYTQALEEALRMMKEEGLPLASRVILAAHQALMEAGEGDKSTPGHYRKQSVRVGELVPPLAPKVPELMSGLEKYINEDSSLPPLIKAGLAHVQFETIHPFLDGNGRIGRLLIVLMLMDSKLLDIPILYPSYYFKKYHLEYYQQLNRVRTHGDFEGWIAYYLRAIKESSLDAYVRAKEIENLEKEIAMMIQAEPKFAKMRLTAIGVLCVLFQKPVASIEEISQVMGKSYNTVHNIIMRFIDLGVVSENKEQQRNKLYCFEPYLQLLRKEQ